ncbi:hypothetical protein ACJ73_08429 [Blastomyces percursus]|uniref:Uncharacterized protein n=1 Tax=Blastomyces percursus TaxID=1658174 RepID=A0A1J9QY33_9EURO|nr:hypothetical protein ACJ73_08429 [Blastomyces percursus]
MSQLRYSETDVRAALQVLQQAPDDALFSVRTEVLTAVVKLRKRLKLFVDRCVDTLDTVLKQTEKIKALRKTGVVNTIDLKNSGQADIRLQHIYAVQPGVTGPKPSVRALFAYRSFGFEFEDYLRSRCGISSRVAEVAEDIRKAEKKDGYIKDFLKDRGPVEELSYRAVRFAVKIRVLEMLFGDPGVSILVSFVYSKIEGGEYSGLAGLARSYSDFVNEGQKQYDGKSSNVSRIE